MSALFHGGDVHAASTIYGRDPSDWIDLSTGINQHSYPVPAIAAAAWHQLPYLNPALQAAAKGYYGDFPWLASSGSQSVIQLLPSLLQQLGNKGPAWLPDVGYQEHAHAWSKQGDTHTYSGLDSALAVEQIDAALQDKTIGHLLIINPNNPTGQKFTAKTLLSWATKLQANNGFLVVDEAFIDTTPDDSLLSHFLPDNLVILRSVGKFFGLAGMRLGFTFAAQRVLDGLAKELGPWAVNGPAQTVAVAALSDGAWQANMRLALANESLKQCNIWQPAMASLGAKLAGAHGLFRSFSMPCDLAQKLHHSAGKSGILIRLVAINSHTSLLRFGNVDLSQSHALNQCKTWIQQES